MRRTPVYIVCSPRPQVGKTLVARLLAEYLSLQPRGVAAFDINLNQPSLHDYLPNETELADVHSNAGKLALMNRLMANDETAKVVDVGFHAFQEFFLMCEQIGYLRDALSHGVAPNVLFLADGDRVSARAHIALFRQVSAEALVVVANDHILHGAIPPTMATGRTIRIGALPSFLKSYIDRKTFSFTNYLRTEADESTEMHSWIRQNYLSIRELEVRLAFQGA